MLFHLAMYCFMTWLCLITTSVIGHETLIIEDFTNSRTILLLYGQERKIRCFNRQSAFNGQVAWYFGNTKSLQRIRFNASGQFLSSTDSSQFRMTDPNGYSIIVKAGDHQMIKDFAGVSATDNDPSQSVLPEAVGPNGILACSVTSTDPGATRQQQALHLSISAAVFHLMVAVPLPVAAASAGGGSPRCRHPGYRLGTWAGRPACHPCLPGEFASGWRACLPCPPGFESHSFASTDCLNPSVSPATAAADTMPQAGPAEEASVPGRFRRAVQTKSSSLKKDALPTGQVHQKRLPLARFMTIIMYHFLLVLMLSSVAFLYLMMVAYSFETVWHGVLSDAETSIASVIEEKVVLNEPEPDKDAEDSE